MLATKRRALSAQRVSRAPITIKTFLSHAMMERIQDLDRRIVRRARLGTNVQIRGTRKRWRPVQKELGLANSPRSALNARKDIIVLQLAQLVQIRANRAHQGRFLETQEEQNELHANDAQEELSARKKLLWSLQRAQKI